MSSNALEAGLRHLRSSMAAQCRNEESDEQLLHAFTARRDEDAFAVLVRRHGSMVLNVCRRVLGQQQDAEDAFQATFLLLARCATGLRKKTALAAFLHGSAYRIALTAKRSAARRRKHECEAASRPTVDPSDELSWREVRALLDKEIARLPEKYRTVFVLCCLEDLSQAEAARRLGVNERTLSSRLMEARKRLGQRLARRGVELTAVLAVTVWGHPSAMALPPLLMTTTIRASLAIGMTETLAGAASASVAELAGCAAAAMRMGKAKTATLVLLAVSVFTGVSAWAYRGLSASVFSPSVQPAAPPTTGSSEGRQTPPASAQVKGKNSVVVRGRVLDPEGKPVKDARLYSPRFRTDGSSIVQRGVSDTDGHFRVELPRSDVPRGGRTPFLAVADGYGVDWADLPEGTSSVELTLRLVKDQPIEGRIVNTEGKPVADAHVLVATLWAAPNAKLDAFLNIWRQDWQLAYREIPKYLSLSLDEILKLVRTDKDGRFRIMGVGCERLAVLQVNKPGIAQPRLRVVTRAGFDPAPLNKAAREQPPSGEQPRFSLLRTLYGPTLDFVVSASCPIEGTVRAAVGGKPIAGIRVWTGDGGYGASAITDKEGRYRLDGLPRTKEVIVNAQPDAASSWLPNGVRVSDRDGLQPLRGDLVLARAVIVTGRVIERTAGKGVPSTVRFAPLADNKYFGKPGHELHDSWNGQATTDAEGRFRLKTLPGTGVLMIRAITSEKANEARSLNTYLPAEFDADDRQRVQVRTDRGRSPYFYGAGSVLEFFKDAHAVRYLDLAPDAEPVHIELFVDRGRTLTVQIQDADGKPLKGAMVAGLTAAPTDISTLSEARCIIYALDPQQPRRLIFYHAERRLAGALIVRGDEKETPVVRLVQSGSVMGRALDEDGRPVAAAAILLSFEDKTAHKLFKDLTRRQPPLTTDKEGRFRIDGMIPKLGFALGFRRDRTVLVQDTRPVQHQVKPGEMLDLGEIRVKPFQPSR